MLSFGRQAVALAIKKQSLEILARSAGLPPCAHSQVLGAQGTWAGVSSFQGNSLSPARSLEQPAISCEILFIFPPRSCENQEHF